MTKFTNNPQHVRTLASEWICTGLFQELGVSCPPVVVIRFSKDFLDQHRNFYIETAGDPQRLISGDHLGSLYPGSVDRDAVYDWLPRTATKLVVNRHHFRGALVLDTWVMQSDRRQAIFVRERIRAGSNSLRRPGLHAQMVDHGMAFGGFDWQFRSNSPQQLDVCSSFFEGVTGLHALEPWLSKIEDFPERTLADLIASVPESWVDRDRHILEYVEERLINRRCAIREHVRQACAKLRGYLPDWVEPRMCPLAQPSPPDNCDSMPMSA